MVISKKQVVREIVERLGKRGVALSPAKIEAVLDTFAETVKATLSDAYFDTDDKINWNGFLQFGVRLRPARMGRNPKTGEKVQIPEKYVPYAKLRFKLNMPQ